MRLTQNASALHACEYCPHINVQLYKFLINYMCGASESKASGVLIQVWDAAMRSKAWLEICNVQDCLFKKNSFYWKLHWPHVKRRLAIDKMKKESFGNWNGKGMTRWPPTRHQRTCKIFFWKFFTRIACMYMAKQCRTSHTLISRFKLKTENSKE